MTSETNNPIIVNLDNVTSITKLGINGKCRIDLLKESRKDSNCIIVKEDYDDVISPLNHIVGVWGVTERKKCDSNDKEQ